MCSSYDYSQEAVGELNEVLVLVSQDVQEILVDDALCQYFFEELGIELQQRE